MHQYMSQLLFDDLPETLSDLEENEDYYFQIADDFKSDKQFILIIYDIVDNRRRTKFAKMLEGYGKRVQKSAFEAFLSDKGYRKLIDEIPGYIKTGHCEDSVRIYKITGKGKVQVWGDIPKEDDEVILI